MQTVKKLRRKEISEEPDVSLLSCEQQWTSISSYMKEEEGNGGMGGERQ
jgi:hypothetical protein